MNISGHQGDSFHPRRMLCHRTQSGAHADVAFLPLGTLAHALDNEAATATLRACREALRPGGLLVLEVARSYIA